MKVTIEFLLIFLLKSLKELSKQLRNENTKDTFTNEIVVPNHFQSLILNNDD